MIRSRLGNRDIADALERVADLLEAQHANPYRVRAYRGGAATLRRLRAPVSEILDAEGVAGLERLPGIGASLASSIDELAFTGRLGLLERLEGQVSPEDLFTTIPGIGEELAHRIHDVLHVETLEELELAASDGRLEQVPGFGPRRARSVRDILATVLARSTRRRARQFQPTPGVRPTRPIGEPDETSTRPDPNLPATRPSVAVLLDVDRDYRRRAAAGQLRRISPRRFNPEGRAWLPIYHTERDGWWFTALYSNTRRAHERGRTHDWVILYFQRNGHEDQCTVVTEYQGELAGRRVVRGRELECLDYYYPTRPSPQAAPPASSPH